MARNHTIPFEWNIQTVTGGRLSGIYMPLIYLGIDNARLEVPEGYIEAFNKKVIEAKSIGMAVPFDDFFGFKIFVKIGIKRMNRGFSSLETTTNLLDGVNHFSDTNQEKILSTDVTKTDDISTAMGYLLVNLVNGELGTEFKGKKFRLFAKGGRRKTLRKHKKSRKHRKHRV
jgi:hypothetical protein